MESITMGDQLTNSAEEDDTQEQDVRPVVRSYGCIFCRRGFTTAQALGGHMNIHRKDRAKGRPSYLSNNNSSKQEDNSFYANPRSYKNSDNQEGNIRYVTSTSSSAQPINHKNSHQEYCHGVIKSPSMEENSRMSLSLQFGWSHGEDDKDSKRITLRGRNEDELDLELRLGHDP